MLRRYEHSDYSTLEQWWKDWNWDPIAQTLLPETGFIVENKAAGFLYKTDSPICWLEWLVSNKETPYEERNQAIDDVVNALLKEALKLGAQAVFTSTFKKSLELRLIKHGFKVGDANVTHLVCRFGE